MVLVLVGIAVTGSALALASYLVEMYVTVTSRPRALVVLKRWASSPMGRRLRSGLLVIAVCVLSAGLLVLAMSAK